MSTQYFQAVSSVLQKNLGALGLAFLLAGPANAGAVFSLDVSQIGLIGDAFTADALKAKEVAHISFIGANGDWHEHNFTYITGIVNNGVETIPGGLGSTYTLYIDFDGTGNIGLQQFFTATENLYVVNGASTFSIVNQEPTVDNHGNTPILIATGGLIAGTTSPPVGELYAKLLASFTPTAAGAAIFQQPQPFPGQMYGDFRHPPGESADAMVPLFDINGMLAGFNLHGGNDTLTFIPEPLSLLLFAGGLPALLGFSRRANKA